MPRGKKMEKGLTAEVSMKAVFGWHASDDLIL
jgi:hypothetical protein